MRKLSEEESKNLVHRFQTEVVPWCEAHEYSLHQAFDISRELDKEKYDVLYALWHTSFGKAFLRSYFSQRGGVLRERKGQ